jgi:hypothetical protein
MAFTNSKKSLSISLTLISIYNVPKRPKPTNTQQALCYVRNVEEFVISGLGCCDVVRGRQPSPAVIPTMPSDPPVSISLSIGEGTSWKRLIRLEWT